MNGDERAVNQSQTAFQTLQGQGQGQAIKDLAFSSVFYRKAQPCRF